MSVGFRRLCVKEVRAEFWMPAVIEVGGRKTDVGLRWSRCGSRRWRKGRVWGVRDMADGLCGSAVVLCGGVRKVFVGRRKMVR